MPASDDIYVMVTDLETQKIHLEERLSDRDDEVVGLQNKVEELERDIQELEGELADCHRELAAYNEKEQ